MLRYITENMAERDVVRVLSCLFGYALKKKKVLCSLTAPKSNSPFFFFLIEKTNHSPFAI